VLHQIGNGALGPVFRAYDSDRDRLVAIKVFRVDLPPERVHQLVAEFEKLIGAELQHPVIAAPRATGIDPGNNAFLAQSFAAADSLDVVMREQGAAPIARVLRVATNLAEALDYAAERQILHGALHPRDVLLSEDDIRIVGLGVSRALERVGVTSPVRRPYSAPERINDEGWDQRADVFSLAAIVYELLCGRRVTGTGSEAAESLTDVAGCDIDALRRVFSLALAADPAYRFATATAFTDALKETTIATAAPAEANVSPAKPKPRRPRTKLRVVSQTLIDAESALEADEPPASEPELIELIEERAQPDVEAAAIDLTIREEPASAQIDPPQLLEFAPERIDDIVPSVPEEVVDEPALALTPRKVPAPTPVAIETVAPVPDLLLDIEVLAPVVRTEQETHIVFGHATDPVTPEQQDLMAFAEASEPLPPAEERYIDVEPQSTAQAPAAPESFEPPPPAEPRLPPFLNPDFSPPSRPDAEPPSHSPVWPIGVAAVIGIAVGFGIGYTVAIRDRAATAITAPVATSSPAPAPVATRPTTSTPAAPAVERPIIEPLVAAPPPKAAPAREETPAPAAPAVFDGRVLVRSTPSGARVFVDGKDRGQTPAAIGDLGRGEHRIRIVRDGYTAAERRVVLSPSRPSQSLSVPLAREPRTTAPGVKAEAKPAQAEVSANPAANTAAQAGTLVVESRPPGATVVIDGRVAGTTPLSIGDVRAGNHAVRIERDGYRAWTSTVTVAGGEQNRVTASLEK
jgi:serine/threonine protein kinase